MAIQMTRAEYESKYGVKPVVASSTLDFSPAPVRMTRAEYEATYNPKPVTASEEIRQDFSQMREAQTQAVLEGADAQSRIKERVASGEISPVKGAFQRFGKGLSTASNVLFQTALGGAKMLSTENFENRVKETLGADLQKVFNLETAKGFVESLEQSKGGVLIPSSVDEKTAGVLREVGEAYKNDETFRTDVQSAGGILEWLSLPGATKTATIAKETAGALTPPIKEVAESVTKKFTPDARNDAAIASEIEALAKIEDKYSPIRKANTFAKDVDASRSRIVQSGVLRNAVDETGTLRTQDAIKAYQEMTVDGLEDVVRKNLINENKTINLKQLETELKAAILEESRLEGADLVQALKGIEKQIQGLSLRSDSLGEVPLYKLQDAKISETKHINFNTPPEVATFRKTVARVYKEAIENNTSIIDVKKVNSELANYYGDIERLRLLDGRKVEGGKIGKYSAGLAGTAIGMAGGSIGGGVGAAVGGVVGGEVASLLKGKSMAGTFKGAGKGLPVNQTLQQAKQLAETGATRSLKVADKKVGVPAHIKKTAEMTKVESQIAKNVEMQKKAIKAGDFTLVAELKKVYDLLLDKLKNLVEDYKKNGVPLGMSIRKSVTPESVAKRIDLEDFNRLVDIIEDPELAKLNPDTMRMIENMGLGNATNEELVSFAKEVTDEAEKYKAAITTEKTPDSTSTPTL